jgi:alpha-N-acetylglucosamine transferase
MDYINLILLSFGFSIGLFGFSFYKGRKLQKEINQLEDLIDELERELILRDKLTNQRVDGEINRVNEISTNDVKFTLSQVESLKMKIEDIQKEFKDKLTSGVEVKTALDRINKVESDLVDFVKMYRNQ